MATISRPSRSSSILNGPKSAYLIALVTSSDISIAASADSGGRPTRMSSAETLARTAGLAAGSVGNQAASVTRPGSSPADVGRCRLSLMNPYAHSGTVLVVRARDLAFRLAETIARWPFPGAGERAGQGLDREGWTRFG